MSTNAGEVTNAVYGFTSMLAIVLSTKPDFAAAAFDMAAPTNRSLEYPEYKQGRRPMPDDLRPQIARVREILEAFSIPVYSVAGYEADDIVGTLSAQAEAADMSVTIVSGDLDCLQLVSESVEAMVPRRGITDTMMYGPAQVRQRYGFEPSQLIDYKALRGDTSDNIPGVAGVGEKTAAKLVTEFGSIESLIERLPEMPAGRIRANLEAAVDQMLLAKRLVTIVRDMPLRFDPEKSRWRRYDLDRVRRLFDDLEFRALLSRFPGPETVPVQPTLLFEPVAVVPKLGVVVSGSDELRDLASDLGGSERIALAGVWEGPARTSGLIGLCLCSGPERSFYLPLNHRAGEANLAPGDLASIIGPVLTTTRLVSHDVKESSVGLLAAGIDATGWGFDTFLAAYLLGAGARDPRLEDLAREFLGMELVAVEEILGSGRSARKFGDCSVSEVAGFAAARAQASFQLQPRLAAELTQLGVDYLFHEIELPLAHVLAKMEQEGVGLDVPYLTLIGAELGGQLAAIEAEVAEVADQPINLNAPAQLARFLFEDLRLPAGKRTKTGYSTDAETLEAVRDKHPIVPRILEHRQLSKLKSTYVDALPLLVDPTTGRVHTSLNQAATATGRLSSSNPNLMNIPVRTDLGQRIRRAFISGRPGQLLFAADYSQIELRIAAHLSEDPQMLAAFAAGQDIHAVTAARVFKVDLGAVQPSQRRLAKIANFGSLYGQGEYGLSLQMGIPGEEAREFLAEYWRTYSRLKEYLDSIRAQARAEGMVVNANGRRRSIPDLQSPNFQLRQAAERMAINFPIQSLQADIIKIAMVRLQAELENRSLVGRMILQVHDELVFDVPASELAVFAEMVPRVMTGAYELATGIEVDAKAGPNWADMVEVSQAVA
jgi:DNA polymerase-1